MVKSANSPFSLFERFFPLAEEGTALLVVLEDFFMWPLAFAPGRFPLVRCEDELCIDFCISTGALEACCFALVAPLLVVYTLLESSSTPTVFTSSSTSAVPTLSLSLSSATSSSTSRSDTLPLSLFIPLPLLATPWLLPFLFVLSDLVFLAALFLSRTASAASASPQTCRPEPVSVVGYLFTLSRLILDISCKGDSAPTGALGLTPACEGSLGSELFEARCPLFSALALLGTEEALPSADRRPSPSA
mmetsp:Transcript_43600/g.75837  ORF Transcript_43600/g.75837 Transcript_43600/m.75837 type:complete len:247 (-) Transcript_43600:2102-2842(-)